MFMFVEVVRFIQILQQLKYWSYTSTYYYHLMNFQLLHPLGENSPIAGFLSKNKNGGIHHICIEVRITLLLECNIMVVLYKFNT